MFLIYPYYTSAYRIRGWGRLPWRRGATLLLSNHQHDLDTTALIMRLAVQTPRLQPIFSVGSRRLFEPSFMTVRFAPIRWIVSKVDWVWMFGLLGVLPIENELRRRSVASLAFAVYRRHGDVPVTDVFADAAMQKLGGETKLSAIIQGSLLDKKRYVSVARMREPYKSELIEEERRQIDGDLARVESVLRAGGTLYLTPEGRYTQDGRINRFRTALYRLAPLADIYLLALSYDPFVAHRLSLLYRVVRLPKDADIRSHMAAARPVTASQLVATFIRARNGAFSRDELITSLIRQVPDLPPGAFVDPELARHPASMATRAFAHMRSTGLLVAQGDGTYRRPGTATDPRFPDVPDILVHQANFFEETLAGLGDCSSRR